MQQVPCDSRPPCARGTTSVPLAEALDTWRHATVQRATCSVQRYRAAFQRTRCNVQRTPCNMQQINCGTTGNTQHDNPRPTRAASPHRCVALPPVLRRMLRCPTHAALSDACCAVRRMLRVACRHAANCTLCASCLAEALELVLCAQQPAGPLAYLHLRDVAERLRRAAQRTTVATDKWSRPRSVVVRRAATRNGQRAKSGTRRVACNARTHMRAHARGCGACARTCCKLVRSASSARTRSFKCSRRDWRRASSICAQRGNAVCNRQHLSCNVQRNL